jgi:hypothetical protein
MSSLVPQWLAGPFFVAAGLLVAAGALKLRRPEPTARALSAVGLPGRSRAVRCLGATEVLVGALGLFHPVPMVAVLLSAMFVSFAGFLGYTILVKVSLSSCGCLGERELAPNRLHLVLNLAAAAAGLGAALRPFPGVAAFAVSLPYRGVPFLAGLFVAGYLVYVIVAQLPQAMFAYGSDTRTEIDSRTALPATFHMRGSAGA